MGIGSGDEVIVPSLTFVATANSVLYTGATPIFADITGVDNLNISPASILEKITPKTKAITVVHYGGYPCDMSRIMRIAREHNLYVIEDAAHAPGAEYDGKKCGTIGDVGCFSFFSNKNLGNLKRITQELNDFLQQVEERQPSTIELSGVGGHLHRRLRLTVAH